MDRGARRAAVHGVGKSHTTEHACIPARLVKVQAGKRLKLSVNHLEAPYPLWKLDILQMEKFEGYMTLPEIL